MPQNNKKNNMPEPRTDMTFANVRYG